MNPPTPARRTRHLDIGCGTRPRNPYRRDEVHGVDIREATTAAGAEIRRANLAVEPIPFPDSHFDSVSAYDFLEHVPRVLPATGGGTRFPFIELMNEVWRVLVPGGRFACEAFVRPVVLEGAPEVRRLFSLPWSPWSDRPHRWLERILTFREQFQRVTHHVILEEDGTIRQHWSRTRLFDRDALAARITASGLVIREWVGHDLGSPVDPRNEQVWVIAERSAED